MKELHVHIGEVKIGKNGEVLTAILGSCIGIALIHRKRHICGLAHCLLPESPTRSFNISGRFVDQAIPSLLALMKIKDQDLKEIEAIIAGGGNMTNSQSKNDSELIGSLNFMVAQRELTKIGIKIIHTESGGHIGRKITVNCADFRFHIESIPRISKTA